MPLYKDANAMFYNANVPLWGCRCKSHNANSVCSIDKKFSFLFKYSVCSFHGLFLFYFSEAWMPNAVFFCPKTMSHSDLRLLKVGDHYQEFLTMGFLNEVNGFSSPKLGFSFRTFCNWIGKGVSISLFRLIIFFWNLYSLTVKHCEKIHFWGENKFNTPFNPWIMPFW